MSRAIRRVPANWSHPKRRNEYHDTMEYKPLMSDYVGSLKYYHDEVKKFIKYMTKVINDGKVKIYGTNYTEPKDVYNYLTDEDELLPPDIKNYMPSGEWYQLYEEVSEGTPITPPFATQEGLKDYLMTKGTFWDSTPWPEHRAQGMVDDGYAMSGIMTNGKFYRAEEAFDIKDTQ